MCLSSTIKAIHSPSKSALSNSREADDGSRSSSDFEISILFISWAFSLIWLHKFKALRTLREEKEIALKQKEEEEIRIREENRRIKEWEQKFDHEQKVKEEELIKKFYTDNPKNLNKKEDDNSSVNVMSKDNVDGKTD